MSSGREQNSATPVSSLSRDRGLGLRQAHRSEACSRTQRHPPCDTAKVCAGCAQLSTGLSRTHTLLPDPPSGEHGHSHAEEHSPAKARARAGLLPRYLRQIRRREGKDLHRTHEGVVVTTVPGVAARPASDHCARCGWTTRPWDATQLPSHYFMTSKAGMFVCKMAEKM